MSASPINWKSESMVQSLAFKLLILAGYDAAIEVSAKSKKSGIVDILIFGVNEENHRVPLLCIEVKRDKIIGKSVVDQADRYADIFGVPCMLLCGMEQAYKVVEMVKAVLDGDKKTKCCFGHLLNTNLLSPIEKIDNVYIVQGSSININDIPNKFNISKLMVNDLIANKLLRVSVTGLAYQEDVVKAINARNEQIGLSKHNRHVATEKKIRRSMYVRMKSKYKNRCMICSERVNIGQRIVWIKDEGVIHPRCVEKDLDRYANLTQEETK